MSICIILQNSNSKFAGNWQVGGTHAQQKKLTAAEVTKSRQESFGSAGSCRLQHSLASPVCAGGLQCLCVRSHGQQTGTCVAAGHSEL